jgi:methylase of polypeptide subunit release factors
MLLSVNVRLIALSDEFTLKDVEVAFENLIDAGRKRSEGVVYTPNYITDYLVSYCCRQIKKISAPTFIDPACGGGGFVLRAIPILAEIYNLSYEQVIAEYVRGMDINADAIHCARLSLDLFSAQWKLADRQPEGIFRVGDSLLTPPKDICESFGIDELAFDIVATNPPYVKLQNLEEVNRIKLSAAYSEFARGNFSLAMLFLIAGYRLLSSRGVLGYITQNNIFTSLSGEGVRSYLQQKKAIHSIIDFEHAKVFNNASAYTCLIFLDKKKKNDLLYSQIQNPKKDLNLGDEKFHSIKIDGLNKSKWRLSGANHLKNIERLESAGISLGALANIRVGFATLKDSVFLLNEKCDQTNVESGIIVPAIKISEFSSEEELKKNKRFIIRPYKKEGGKWRSLSESEIKFEFPNAFNYLKRHQDALLSRDKGKRQPKNFFEWSRTQGMESKGPKLLTKTFSKGPNFMLDETDSLFCNGYSVIPKSNDDLFGASIDIRVLQKILNSWVMDYYTRLTTFQIQGGYQCFQKNFIERFCIPEISENNKKIIMSLEGNDLQYLICELFGIPVEEILEIVTSASMPLEVAI